MRFASTRSHRLQNQLLEALELVALTAQRPDGGGAEATWTALVPLPPRSSGFAIADSALLRPLPNDWMPQLSVPVAPSADAGLIDGFHDRLLAWPDRQDELPVAAEYEHVKSQILMPPSTTETGWRPHAQLFSVNFLVDPDPMGVGDDDDAFIAYFASLRRLLSTAQSSQCQNSVFVWSRDAMLSSSLMGLRPRIWDAINAFVNDGGRVKALQVAGVQEGNTSPSTLASVVCSLVKILSRDSALEFSAWDTLGDTSLQCLGSALLLGSCGSLERLSLRIDSDKRRFAHLYWRWIGCGLFRADSRHRITTLTLLLDSALPEVIEAVAEALGAADPLPLLASLCLPPASAAPFTPWVYGEVELSADAVLRLLHLHDQGQYPWHEVLAADVLPAMEPLVCIIVRDEPSELSMFLLLPCLGHVRIDRRHIQRYKRITHRTFVLTEKRDHGIRSLELVVMEQACIPNALRLLTLIGRPIEHLTVDFKSKWTNERVQVFDEEFLCYVSRACPNLRVLRIRGLELHTLDFIWQMGNRGHLSRLACLGLRPWSLPRGFAPLHALAQTLGDMTTPFSRRLREVGLVLRDCPSRDAMSDLLDAFSQMLERNDRLEWCGLGNVRDLLRGQPPDATLEALGRFTEHDRLALTTRASHPTAMGLLSVLRPAHTHCHEPTSARDRLGAEGALVQAILGLAILPTTRIRRVCLQYYF